MRARDGASPRQRRCGGGRRQAEEEEAAACPARAPVASPEEASRSMVGGGGGGGAMRSVSYVQRVALDFSGGSLFPHAVCLGDADNDGVGAEQGRREEGSPGGGLGPPPPPSLTARRPIYLSVSLCVSLS